MQIPPSLANPSFLGTWATNLSSFPCGMDLTAGLDPPIAILDRTITKPSPTFPFIGIWRWSAGSLAFLFLYHSLLCVPLLVPLNWVWASLEWAALDCILLLFFWPSLSSGCVAFLSWRDPEWGCRFLDRIPGQVLTSQNFCHSKTTRSENDENITLKVHWEIWAHSLRKYYR